MKNIKILLVCIIVLVAANFVLPVRSYADNAALQIQIDATKHARDELVAEQNRLQAELDNLNAQGQNLNTTIKSLDATKKKLQNDIKLTQNKIGSANLNIENLENSISDKESAISTHTQAIKDAIKSLSEYDNHSLIGDVLSYPSLSDVWQDKANLDGISTTLRDEIKSLNDTKQALSKEKEVKEATKKELVSLSSELTGQKQVVETTQSTQKKLLADTKSQEALYQQRLVTLKQQEAQMESDLYKLESQINFHVDVNSYPAPKHGILSWPLDKVYVTQKFGQTVGGQQLYAEGFHNGVDFRASMGTAVRAPGTGIVRGTGNTDLQKGCYSYGRWVLIDYGNGLTTIFGHLSASLVKAGQAVTVGQIVGYSGGAPGADGAGYSTGPHLHVGLFATDGVKIEQFVTSKGCKQVFVPIADHKAYLDPLAYLPAI
jgi:murein DD-endopeptidase MepM/ murein hydrolase activator NlpD